MYFHHNSFIRARIKVNQSKKKGHRWCYQECLHEYNNCLPRGYVKVKAGETVPRGGQIPFILHMQSAVSWWPGALRRHSRQEIGIVINPIITVRVTKTLFNVGKYIQYNISSHLKWALVAAKSMHMIIYIIWVTNKQAYNRIFILQLIREWKFCVHQR